MVSKNISAVDNIVLFSIEALYPVPSQVDGFAPDDAYSVDGVAPVIVVMGVDGKMSKAVVAHEVKTKFKVSPDSAALPMITNWYQTQRDTGIALEASVTIIQPGVGVVAQFTKGALTHLVPLAAAKKKLEPQDFEITFEKINLSPGGGLSV